MHTVVIYCHTYVPMGIYDGRVVSYNPALHRAGKMYIVDDLSCWFCSHTLHLFNVCQYIFFLHGNAIFFNAFPRN